MVIFTPKVVILTHFQTHPGVWAWAKDARGGGGPPQGCPNGCQKGVQKGPKRGENAPKSGPNGPKPRYLVPKPRYLGARAWETRYMCHAGYTKGCASFGQRVSVGTPCTPCRATRCRHG